MTRKLIVLICLAVLFALVSVLRYRQRGTQAFAQYTPIQSSPRLTGPEFLSAVDDRFKGTVPVEPKIQGKVFIEGKSTDGSNHISNVNINAVVNVKAYGAKGDGSTDDHGAFEHAVAALGSPGGTVLVPASGNAYVWSSEVHFPRNVILQGQGVVSSTIKCTQHSGTSACAAWSDGGSENAYVQGGARDIAFDGPGTSTTTAGVYTGGDPANKFSARKDFGDSLRFERVRVYNFGTGYAWGNNSFSVTWLMPDIEGNGTGINADQSSLTNSGENMAFISGTVRNNTRRAVYLNTFGPSQALHFISVSFDYNAAPTIASVNPNAIFTDCHFEQHSGDIIDEGTANGGWERIVINGGEMLLTSKTGSDAQFINISNGGSPTTVSMVLQNVVIGAFHSVGKLVNNPSGWDVAEIGLVNNDTNVADWKTWANTISAYYLNVSGVRRIDNFGHYLPPIAATGVLEKCTPDLEGSHGVFNDCNADCSAGGSCTTGGSTHCEVYCNGSSWVETGR